jgi:hypothetical protein
MKYYPELRELPTMRETIDIFNGYNHNLRIGDGEFYDMKNLTSNDFPVLSPRPVRGIYASPGIPQGMIAKEKLCYIDGGDFIIGDERISMGLTVDRDADGNIIPKSLISMGAYVIIMPDKRYINTSDTSDRGSIEASLTTSEPVTFLLCTLEGADLDIFIGETDEPPTRFWSSGQKYYINKNAQPPVLKMFSESTRNLESVATTYIKISSPGIGLPFEVYDGVKIEGVESELLADLNNVMPIWAKGDDYIVVTGVPTLVTTQETQLKKLQNH